MAMIPPRSGSGGGTFKPCPTGLQQLVCCDVIDLGMVTSSYNGEAKTMHKVSLRWQSAKLMSDGKPYLVQKRYTYSLHPKATLRKDLDGWRGKALTDAACETFDLEKLLGVNAYANITHTVRGGDTYANVAALMPYPNEQPKLFVTGYVRVVARTKDDPPPPPPCEDSEWGAENGAASGPVEAPSEDDIPF